MKTPVKNSCPFVSIGGHFRFFGSALAGCRNGLDPSLNEQNDASDVRQIVW